MMFMASPPVIYLADVERCIRRLETVIAHRFGKFVAQPVKIRYQ